MLHLASRRAIRMSRLFSAFTSASQQTFNWSLSRSTVVLSSSTPVIVPTCYYNVRNICGPRANSGGQRCYRRSLFGVRVFCRTVARRRFTITIHVQGPPIRESGDKHRRTRTTTGCEREFKLSPLFKSRGHRTRTYITRFEYSLDLGFIGIYLINTFRLARSY